MADDNAQLALDDQAIKDFLRKDPAFFERNAAFLADIHLPSPHGSGTVSLTERQQLAQRDKIRATEAIMEDMVTFGKKNEQINQKLHALSVAMIANDALATLPEVVDAHIKNAFSLSHASMHCWGIDETNIPALPEAFMHWMLQQIAPYCGPSNVATEALVEAEIINASLTSFALIPLYAPAKINSNQAAPSMGVLILGSEDASHFNAEMGTLFLQRISEMLSAATYLAVQQLINEAN